MQRTHQNYDTCPLLITCHDLEGPKHWTKPSLTLGTMSFKYCFQIKVNIWTTSFMHLLHRHQFYFYSISLFYIILTSCSSLNYPLLFSYHLMQSISLATGYNNTYVYKKINKFELPIIKVRNSNKTWDSKCVVKGCVWHWLKKSIFFTTIHRSHYTFWYYSWSHCTISATF